MTREQCLTEKQRDFCLFVYVLFLFVVFFFSKMFMYFELGSVTVSYPHTVGPQADFCINCPENINQKKGRMTTYNNSVNVENKILN